MTPSTYFGLLAEFGAAHIPVTEIGQKYFGHSETIAKRTAKANKYPFPTFRAGNQQSTLMVDIIVFADYLDKIKEKARIEFNLAK
jgi:hypothetical protein